MKRSTIRYIGALPLAIASLLAMGCSTTITAGTNKLAAILQAENNIITVEYVAVPFSEDGKTIILEGMLYRDMERRSWPGVVMTHGRRGPRPRRNENEVFGYEKLNLSLADRGYAVLFLVRRGYGRSGGRDSEFLDTPEQSGIAAGQDIKAGVEYLNTIAGVDGTNIMIMGHSQGGWAAIGAASLNIEGVTRAINLAGGTNYKRMGIGIINDKVQEDWIKGAAALGEKNIIPMIWIYSNNDRNHPPLRVKEAFDAFREAGGAGELILLEDYKENGHLFVQEPSLFLHMINKAL